MQCRRCRLFKYTSKQLHTALSCITGRDPRYFKFFDVFDEEFQKLNSAEIDVQVDESGQ